MAAGLGAWGLNAGVLGRDGVTGPDLVTGFRVADVVVVVVGGLDVAWIDPEGLAVAFKFDLVALRVPKVEVGLDAAGDLGGEMNFDFRDGGLAGAEGGAEVGGEAGAEGTSSSTSSGTSSCGLTTSSTFGGSTGVGGVTSS